MASAQARDEPPRLEKAERVVAVRGGGYFPVLIRLRDGRLAAVVRGGAPHLGIGGRLDWIESRDGGRTWSAPRPIVDSPVDDRNPALGEMPDGSIALAYAECSSYDASGKWSPSPGGFRLFHTRSEDGGRTWSPKAPLDAGPIGEDGSPYGRIVTLKDGTALLSVYGQRDPAYVGPVRLPEGAGPGLVGLLRSRDSGRTWGDFSLVSASGHNETTLLPMPDGALLAALRTESGQVDRSCSDDGGRTWSAPRRVTGGPDGTLAQHPADLIPLRGGDALMVYGSRVPPYGAHALLVRDGGATWDYDHRVALGWTCSNTDCGYPSAVQLDDGTIVCLYYAVGTSDLLATQQAIAVRFQPADLSAAMGR